MKGLLIDRASLAALPEYSCSIPTGVVVGKRWRRDVSFGRPGRGRPGGPAIEWLIGEYTLVPGSAAIAITWAWAEIEPGKVHSGALP